MPALCLSKKSVLIENIDVIGWDDKVIYRNVNYVLAFVSLPGQLSTPRAALQADAQLDILTLRVLVFMKNLEHGFGNGFIVHHHP